MPTRNYPKACWCTSECTHAVNGTKGTVVKNPRYIGDKIEDVLIRNWGLETNYIYKDDFAKNMSGLLFEIKPVQYEDGTMRMVYRVKSSLWAGKSAKSVDITTRNGQCVVHWYEGTALNDTTTLESAVTATDNTIELADASKIWGISTPMTLIVKDEVNKKRIKLTVVDVDNGNPNLLTLKDPAPVDIDASACVMRGHYNPAAGCENSYNNSVSFYNNDKEYISYFTRVIHTLEFNSKCTLNANKLSDLLNGDDNSQVSAAYEILQSNFQIQFDEALKTVVRSAFFHTNKQADSVEYSETYGLLAAMADVHDDDVPQFFDMSTCLGEEGTCEADDADALIDTFLKIVQSRAQLSVYSDTQKVMVAVNQQQMNAIQNLRKYFEMYTGEIRTIEQMQAWPDDVISTRRTTFVIEDRGYKIAFVYEPTLNEIPWEFGVIMPENTMGLFTYEYDTVEVNDNGVQFIENDQQLIAGDTVKLRIAKDERNNNNVDRCSKYDLWLDYAIVWLYVDKCAYAGISNFALPQDTDCHSCTVDSSADIPFIG